MHYFLAFVQQLPVIRNHSVWTHHNVIHGIDLYPKYMNEYPQNILTTILAKYKVTSPCMVQVLGSKFAFSIFSISARSCSDCFSCVERLSFFCKRKRTWRVISVNKLADWRWNFISTIWEPLICKKYMQHIYLNNTLVSTASSSSSSSSKPESSSNSSIDFKFFFGAFFLLLPKKSSYLNIKILYLALIDKYCQEDGGFYEDVGRGGSGSDNIKTIVHVL